VPAERDYYSILQVNRNATQDEIERSYRRLSRIYDPATSRKAKAPLRYREITEAYEVLVDPARRAEYDRRHKARPGWVPYAPGQGPLLALPGNPYLWVGGVLIVAVVALVAALLLVLTGSDEEEFVFTTPAPTPGTTAPASPPEVNGEVITTENGLRYIDIEEGTGPTPQPGQTVAVHYTGWLESDGSKFDSSLDRGTPFSFELGAGRVIRGWEEGLATMKEGGKRRLIIPPELAYGETERPGIPANSTLIFDVELIEVRE
jgi:peptidylprolyl isomerase